jgi:hypothetical protein
MLLFSYHEYFPVFLLSDAPCVFTKRSDVCFYVVFIFTFHTCYYLIHYAFPIYYTLHHYYFSLHLCISVVIICFCSILRRRGQCPNFVWDLENLEHENKAVCIKTPWPESASELYRLSDRRLSAKLVPTFADRESHVVSVTEPYGRTLDYLDWGYI